MFAAVQWRNVKYGANRGNFQFSRQICMQRARPARRRTGKGGATEAGAMDDVIDGRQRQACEEREPWNTPAEEQEDDGMLEESQPCTHTMAGHRPWEQDEIERLTAAVQRCVRAIDASFI